MSEQYEIPENLDELIEPEFNEWWEEHGQFIRSGGSSYERTFAFGAFRYLMPKILSQNKQSKYWTQADKDAGLLPVHGSFGFVECRGVREAAEYLGNDCESTKHCHIKFSDGFCMRIKVSKFLPIETPEEKAECAKEHWAARAAELYMKSSTNEVFDFIYDSLLSGELAMPEAIK